MLGLGARILEVLVRFIHAQNDLLKIKQYTPPVKNSHSFQIGIIFTRSLSILNFLVLPICLLLHFLKTNLILRKIICSINNCLDLISFKKKKKIILPTKFIDLASPS